MKLFKTLFVAALACLFTVSVQAQSDEINISAAFSSSIDLTVTNGANISFTVASLTDYNDGLADLSGDTYTATFVINSSVDFKVDLGSTDFTNPEGDVLAAANFGYEIFDNGTNVVGTNHQLVGGTTSPSTLTTLGSATEIITATGDGNAGSSTSNSFKIRFQLGTAAVRAVSGLGTLLSQNIAPSTYSATVTLTASAVSV
ncbi:MAG: hypothetical protein AAF824_05990 [Bacteroidota bacterium]